MKYLLYLSSLVILLCLACKKTIVQQTQLYPTKADVTGLWIGKYGNGVSRIDTSIGNFWCWVAKINSTTQDSIFVYLGRDTIGGNAAIYAQGVWVLASDTLSGSFKSFGGGIIYNFKTLLYNPFKRLDGIATNNSSFTLFMDKK